jgi:hypothetical protein
MRIPRIWMACQALRTGVFDRGEWNPTQAELGWAPAKSEPVSVFLNANC